MPRRSPPLPVGRQAPIIEHTHIRLSEDRCPLCNPNGPDRNLPYLREELQRGSLQQIEALLLLHTQAVHEVEAEIRYRERCVTGDTPRVAAGSEEQDQPTGTVTSGSQPVAPGEAYPW